MIISNNQRNKLHLPSCLSLVCYGIPASWERETGWFFSSSFFFLKNSMTIEIVAGSCLCALAPALTAQSGKRRTLQISRQIESIGRERARSYTQLYAVVVFSMLFDFCLSLCVYVWLKSCKPFACYYKLVMCALHSVIYHSVDTFVGWNTKTYSIDDLRPTNSQ